MSRVGGRVEGRWPCRGQVAVSRAGPRVEAKGQPQFSKKWLTYIGPIKMSVAKKKRGMVQLANRSSAALPPPKMTHGGAREGAGRKRSTNEQPHREREKFTTRCPVPIGVDHAENEAGYQESAAARCVSKD